MDGDRKWSWRGIGFSLLLLSSCAPEAAVDDLPSPGEILAAAGKRLIGSHSTAELTTMALRGDRVLAALTHAERDALARGSLRFRIDRSADVYVAATRGSVPFWVDDLGFEPTRMTYLDRVVFQKAYASGTIGLGVNGLDRRSPSHYAVFVRSRDGRPVTISGVVGPGWQVSDASSKAGLPEQLRDATRLNCRDDLRHSTLLAGGRVWKTHVVSSRKPDQVTIAFGADTGRELVWSWRTSPEVTKSIVRLRELRSDRVREVSGRSETIALRELLNDPVVRRHTVRVDGLKPGSAYEYAVGDEPSGGSVVRTASSHGDASLLYLGDPQCGLEGWGKLLAAAYRKRPDADALLIAGDLVDRGNERTNWDHFFLRASGVFERLPLMPCVGNHEYLDRGPWLYRSIFTLPANGPTGIDRDLVYHFEVGDAFIAVLDSTLAVSDPASARLQADWLDGCLSRTKKTWKLVMFHHPVYASHTWRENPSLQVDWVPVFDKHHVDLVFQGHDHAYLRTYPMRANARVGSTAEGTVYVVSVSGDKYCEQDPRGYTEVGFTGVSTYQTIDINARQNRLVYKSFDINGRERDGFTIEKSSRELAASVK